MIRINLLPVREARRAANLRQQGVLLGAAMLVACGVCVLLHLSVASSISGEREKIAAAEAELAKLEVARKDVERFQREKEEIEQKLGVIQRLEESRSGPVRIMDEIASRIPERLWLAEMDMRGGRLRMKGRSLDNEVVAAFMTSLEASPMISGVELKETNLVEAGGLKLVDFEIQSRQSNKPAPPAGQR
jgi:type IV pilus assembly protein PilN